MATKRILIVDDDPPSLHLMRELLASRGYAVLTAVSRLDAQRVLAEQSDPVDLLIADVVLPERERGFELAWRMLNDHPGLPVLLVSAHASTGDELHAALPTDHSAFLEKPLDPATFLDTVESLLQ